MNDAAPKKKRASPSRATAAERKERAGIQSLARAFAILEEVARSRDGIGLAELSKRVGLHNSTAFHLVRTLVDLGYVRQLAESKRYRIGRPLFALAAASLDEIELVSLATPILEDLAAATGESCHLAIRSGDDVVIVARTAGAGAFQLTDRAGVVRPAHATALGKVLLAALSDEQLRRFLSVHPLRPFTPRTIVERRRLLREIVQVRKDGCAYDDGEFNAEVRCAAVPVRDFTGKVTGSLGVSGPVWRLSLPALQQHTRLVREAAQRLSRELGGDQTGARGNGRARQPRPD